MTVRTRSRNAHRGARPQPPARPPLDVAGTPEEVALRARLLSRGWRTAYLPGQCAVCGDGFHPPQAIRLVTPNDARPQYRADCCPGDDRG